MKKNKLTQEPRESNFGLILAIIVVALCVIALPAHGQSVDLQQRNIAHGASLPSSCTVGDEFDLTSATAGQNYNLCTATNVWTQQAGGGGGGTSAVFAGSASPAPTFSATPTFSLAAVSNQSPLRIEPGVMSANVTAVTFSNVTAGAKFSIAWTQAASGGPYTVTYGGSTINTCAISPIASVVTVQEFEVGNDGSTVKGTSCSSSETGVIRNVEVSNPSAPSTGYALNGDSTNHVLHYVDSTQASVTAVPVTCTNQVATALSAAGVFTCTSITSSYVSGTTGTGNFVLATSPTLVTPALGTPSSGNASNLTNLPITLTTTGTSGAATWTQSTDTLNIPQYAGGSTGTVGGCGSAGINAKTGSYTLTSSDAGYLVTYNGSSLTATLYASPASGYQSCIENLNASPLTVATNSLQYNTATTSITLQQYQTISFSSNGTNYFGTIPSVAGTGNSFTQASNGQTQAATTAYQRRSCTFDNDFIGTAMVAGDFTGKCVVPFAATIVEVDVSGGTGTSTAATAPTYSGTGSIQIGKHGASNSTALLSGALATASGVACALTTTSGTCLFNNAMASSSSVTISTTALAAGDQLYILPGTPDGTQTWYSVTVVFTAN